METAQGLDYCHEVSNKPTHAALYSTTYEAKYTWMELIKLSYLFQLWYANYSSHGSVLLTIHNFGLYQPNTQYTALTGKKLQHN